MEPRNKIQDTNLKLELQSLGHLAGSAIHEAVTLFFSAPRGGSPDSVAEFWARILRSHGLIEQNIREKLKNGGSDLDDRDFKLFLTTLSVSDELKGAGAQALVIARLPSIGAESELRPTLMRLSQAVTQTLGEAVDVISDGHNELTRSIIVKRFLFGTLIGAFLSDCKHFVSKNSLASGSLFGSMKVASILEQIGRRIFQMVDREILGLGNQGAAV